MEVETHQQGNKQSMQDEILEGLSPFENKLCENLIRAEIHKGGCKYMQKALELNIQKVSHPPN